MQHFINFSGFNEAVSGYGRSEPDYRVSVNAYPALE
jgi:hypothetical protein